MADRAGNPPRLGSQPGRGDQEAQRRQEHPRRESAAHGRAHRPYRPERDEHPDSDLDHPEQRREPTHAHDTVDPAHQRAVRHQRPDALGLVGGEHHPADPEQHDRQAVAADVQSDRFQSGHLGNSVEADPHRIAHSLSLVLKLIADLPHDYLATLKADNRNGPSCPATCRNIDTNERFGPITEANTRVDDSPHRVFATLWIDRVELHPACRDKPSTPFGLCSLVPARGGSLKRTRSNDLV